VQRHAVGDAAKSAGILAISWIAYSAVRVFADGTDEVARQNARLVSSFQDSIGIGVESALQAAFLGETVATIANSYYLLHFPATVLLLVVTFARTRKTVFPIVRDGLVIMTLVGVVVHLIFPLAPPRMLDGIIDASTTYGPDPYAIPGSGAANQFAAMPSMHVAWAIVAGWALYRAQAGRPLRVLGVVHPVVTVLVVVITGHHFVLDALVGSVLAAVGLVIAARLHRPKATPVEKSLDIHSSSTSKLARNRAISPSYPLVAHRARLARLEVCRSPRANHSERAPFRPSSALSYPVVKIRVCSSRH
jgi:membrane-associated phospholipid phosphatase